MSLRVGAVRPRTTRFQHFSMSDSWWAVKPRTSQADSSTEKIVAEASCPQVFFLEAARGELLVELPPGFARLSPTKVVIFVEFLPVVAQAFCMGANRAWTIADEVSPSSQRRRAGVKGRKNCVS